ncbi:glycerol kinase GlpK [Saccharospirillum mangrovi]|uniref:glycerol kinase GlpK n=1 Tax=Saccharospirillum mangrovi TaxID=2161747 RepID=UPI000D3AB7F6|nr:glycerol kinase GlpK [Saccharospirillum mangrovi]
MSDTLLAIDQGTTSTRAILFNRDGQALHSAQQEFRQIFPRNGWVEHAPEDIWQSTVSVCRSVLEKAGMEASEIRAIGITNQRETTLVWDKQTGEPVYNAIVWQDRRTADFCHQLRDAGNAAWVAEKTGLLLDPYFSGTKVRWILDNVDGARERAERGELAFGTVDSFLLWRLTGGAEHATDATNASRTLLFNIHTQNWDSALLDMLDVPASMMPTVKDCAADYGNTDPSLFGAAIPIRGIAGDQHAALFGQACYQPGMVKSTYGTGCFMVMNTGKKPLLSRNKLLTTVGYRLNGEVTYALEGSIFMAGATMQWLRDGLKLIDKASDSTALAEQVGPDQAVYLVPAFTGLGAPYWDPDARGAVVGLTRDSGIAEVVTAGLQSVAYQTRDLVDAMRADGAKELEGLRVDGGMAVNDWTMQFLADILGTRVDRPTVTETTALGAAFLAGLASGLYTSLDDIAAYWQCDRRFDAQMPATDRDRLYAGWQRAVKGVRQVSHDG